MNNERYAVRLDVLRVLNGDNEKHSLMIAESLLKICGLIEIWDDPIHGHRVFYVRDIPQDIPQAGLQWIQVEIQKNPYNDLFNPSH